MNRIITKNKVCLQTQSRIWNNLKIDTLNKKKWLFFKKNLKRKNKNFRRATSLKRIFKNRLLNKQKLKSFYGNLLQYQLRSIFKLALKSSKYKSIQFFITLLERRLDIVIFRLKFTSTIFESQQLIAHKKILVNNKIMNYKNYYLKEGDIVSFNDSSTIINNKQITLKYIENSTILNCFVFVRTPLFNEIKFPFVLDIKLLVNYLNHRI
jgi:small subunit ribosomal protein S4